MRVATLGGMLFRASDTVPRGLLEVEAAVLSPASARLRPQYLPAVARVTVEHQTVTDDAASRVVTAESRSSVELSRGRPLVRVVWRECIQWDRRRHEGRFSVGLLAPRAVARRFSCGGAYVLRALGPSATSRIVEGEVHVDAPWIGPSVEAHLVEIVRAQLRGEARLLEALAARGASWADAFAGGEASP